MDQDITNWKKPIPGKRLETERQSAGQAPLLSRIRNLGTGISSLGSLFSGVQTFAPKLASGGQKDTTTAADIIGFAGNTDNVRTPCAQEENQRNAQSYYDFKPHEHPTSSWESTPLVPSQYMEAEKPSNRDVQQTERRDVESGKKRYHPGSDSVSGYISSDPDTPPLTPDTFFERKLTSHGLINSYNLECLKSAGYNVNTLGEDIQESHAMPMEVMKGKQPDRSISPNKLSEDLPLKDADQRELNLDDERDGWYGLEYTLEISSRERHPSDTQSASAGEHSKSRESWAALHKGRIHPFFEDENYYQWKNWHKYLDRQDERRKHRKGFEFLEQSKHLSWLYLSEMRTRDVMYWQKEVFGIIGKDVKGRLETLAENRQDPYNPPQKHNLGWYLKRSRSVCCMRELTYKISD